MRSKQKVVEAHSRLWCLWVSMRILRAYCRRVEEGRSRDSVHAETEDVERGEIYSEAERGFARVVGDGLWVKAA